VGDKQKTCAFSALAYDAHSNPEETAVISPQVHMDHRLPALAVALGVALWSWPALAKEPVTYENFVRAETDMTLKRFVDQGAFGECFHIRQPTPLDKQDVIRMNRDTLYSACIFDLTEPVTISKPDSGDRFQSMHIINQDHSMLPVEHGAGDFTFTKDDVGARYVIVLFRTFMDATNPDDIKAANKLQDAIKWQQKDSGKFEIPDWDEVSLVQLREALNVVAATASDASGFFGDKDKLNPIDHLLGTAYGWGGNPKEAAMYANVVPPKNDGKTPHSVTAKDVPVDGFWSVTVYNAKGYMDKNDADAYSFNNVTAKPNDDGSVTINFGGCGDGRINCLPISQGWNISTRMYEPKKEIIDGSWKFPEPKPVT
jgi:hypothetical protein